MLKLNKNTGHRGFTLIELMIVVAIIGILAAVAVPKFAEMIRKSKEGATKGSLSALRSALTIYNSDNEGMPPLARMSTPGSLTVTDNQNNAILQLNMAMMPKYVEAWPTAKLGTYRPDTNQATVVSTSGRGQAITLSAWVPTIGTQNMSDQNGWMFTSTSEGAFWVNSVGTDTKGEYISSW